MAAYTKTITVSVKVFGPEPTEKWALSGTLGAEAMVWGSDYWGYGTVGLPLNFAKGILGNTITPSGESYRNFTKRQYESQVITNVVAGLSVSKGIFEAVANTTAVGKSVDHYYANSVANTTAVGRDFVKFYENSQPIDSTIDRFAEYSISSTQSVVISTGQSVYKMVQSYTVTYGGISNIVDWPRALSFTAVSMASTSWTSATRPSTTWS